MPSEAATIIVLKKTKLGETDLIVTGFSAAGRQVRAVAKGGRKPGSRTGAHLELFCVSEVLLGKGRNLDVVSEARILDANLGCRQDVEHSAAAGAVVELLDKVSQDGTVEERLFAMAREALRCIGSVEIGGLELSCAAALLKIAAQIGLCPELGACAVCGATTDGGDTPVFLDIPQGGIICQQCRHEHPYTQQPLISKELRLWLCNLLSLRFSDLEPYATGKYQPLGRQCLQIAQQWLSCHLNLSLKSLDFLLTS
jgi:DNA repair protein RecO (recombination protein O)